MNENLDPAALEFVDVLAQGLVKSGVDINSSMDVINFTKGVGSALHADGASFVAAVKAAAVLLVTAPQP